MSGRKYEATPEHKMAMDAVGLAAQILTPQADVLGALISAEQEMHSFAHITDPTLYRDAINSKSLALQVRMAKAAIAFVLEIQSIKSELAHPNPIQGDR